MSVVRVVSFEGVSADRVEEMRGQMQDAEQPEGINATEVVMLHDAGAEKALVLLFFDSEEDYARADEALNAMPTSDTPGQRAGVAKYDVAMRMTA
jgi:hypothetical protein